MKQPTRDTQPPTLAQAIRYIGRLALVARRYWGDVFRVSAIGVAAGLVSLLIPLLTKTFIDEAYPSQDVTLMNALVAGILAFAVASAFVGGLRGYLAQTVTGRLASALNLMFFNHLQHLPVRFFDEHRVGEITSRLGETRVMLGTLSNAVQSLVLSRIYLVLIPPILLIMDWRLGLVALGVFPLTSAVALLTGKLRRRLWKQSAEATADLSALQVEVMSHIRSIKALAAEHFVFRRAHEQSEHALRMQLRAGGWTSLVALTNGVLRGLGTAAFTWYAWSLILQGRFTLGGFVAFSAYLGYLTGPITQLTGLFSTFQQTAVTLSRAFEYLDTAPEQDPASAFRTPHRISRAIQGDIAFSEVSFSYSPSQQVLSGVTFTAARGSVTSIIGPSGAGKSTLLRLLVRMDDPQAGQITVDQTPLPQIAPSELRRQISVVWQEFTLMRGTLWENLTFGLADISQSGVESAVRLCRVDDLVRDLPGGYHGQVAEWGATLSGGQRQRIALARAIIRRTPLLLLDEATSQIDVELERQILDDLLLDLRGTTILLVTHRLVSAAAADQILLLNGGRVVASGSHRELLAHSEAYKAMVEAAGPPAEPRRPCVLVPHRA